MPSIKEIPYQQQRHVAFVNYRIKNEMKKKTTTKQFNIKHKCMCYKAKFEDIYLFE
jgi:hypothetical protein